MMDFPLPQIARAVRRILMRLLLLGVLLGTLTAHAKPPASTPAPPTASLAPAVTPIPLTAIAEKSQETISRLDAMAADSPADESGVTAARQALPDLSTRIDQWLTNSAKSLAERPSLDSLRDLQTSGSRLTEELNAQITLLNGRAKTLGVDAALIKDDEATWNVTTQEAKDPAVPPETRELCQSVQTSVKDADAKIKARTTGILEQQNQLNSLAGKLSAGLQTVKQADAAALKTLFVRDGAPLWAPQPSLAAGEASEAAQSSQQQVGEARDYARQHLDLIYLHVAIFLGLLGLMLWLKRGLQRWTEEDPDLQRAAPIFEVPIATALALSFVVKGPIYSDAPVAFRAVLGIGLLLPVIVLLRRLLDRRLHPALYFLLLFYFVGEVHTTLASHLLLSRWLIATELLVLILVIGWITRTSRSGPADGGAGAVLGKWPRRLCRLAILILLGALAAEILGYVRLGTTVGLAVLRSGYVAVFFYALVQVLAGLLLIALRVGPLSISHIARQHRAAVHQRICGGLRLLAVLGWLWLTLGFFELQTAVVSWITAILNFQGSAGTVTLSVGKLLGFAAALWLSVLAARLIRFFLEEEVFERVKLSPGLPYAISTILNYLILFLGSLIALGVLGVGLSQITLLAGAFSVGLGFGLQNIINNFVSGIILLFERPVKVGDIIQIGDATGEVRRIGIRASVIGTREGSDIIVPNGNLISNQFTNWTYSDRHRYLEIPLSIASGPEPNHVLALLKTAAAGHTATKNQTAPEAYIIAFTATGISLVVRAWISQYEDWVQTRSELSVALVEALAHEGIKLA